MTTQTKTRRAGGREARRTARANPLSDALRPIRPGLEGGTYRPLSDAQMQRIHHAVLDALEQTTESYR
jgi:trimethylamine--corrinoid protein Co-methyltransferase